MKIAFLTEMAFTGKVPADNPNMRTEFAWMNELNADHHYIRSYDGVFGYDYVFIIFPKGRVYLDACGSRISNETNPVSDLLSSNIVLHLKQHNKKVFYVQEGPHWLYNDYELADQINFYNMLSSCDALFAHNNSDVGYYKGLFRDKPVHVLPTLMIESTLQNLQPKAEEKVIVGGNFARWYGGFESFIVAQTFDLPVWGQTSHAMRDGEDQLLNHLPRVVWIDWMKQLSTFKYAIHLMPTVAAGTFSLNCAYFGIPCIGNQLVDTQKLCHPDLSVDVFDISKAQAYAHRLKTDSVFYNTCSEQAKNNYKKYFSQTLFKQKIELILKQYV